MRLLSLLVTSFSIPLAYTLARSVPIARPSALAVAGFLAAMPAFVIDCARIGGHALAIPMIGAALLCAVRVMRRGTARNWSLLGLALGAALLSKGYALAALPLVPLAALLAVAWGQRRSRYLSPLPGSLLAVALAFATAGWWYLDNLRSTGTLAGEQMDVASHAGAAQKLAAVSQVAWLRVLDSAAMTHIWIGGWSFLLVRSWMYRIFEMLALLALLGILRNVRRLARDPRFVLVAASYAIFCLAMAYFAVTTVLAVQLSAAPGWYLNGVAVAESVLFACGAAGIAGVRRAPWCLAAATVLAAALDLYTVHFLLIPYYTGQIRHRVSGVLQSLPLDRLSGSDPRWLWAAYLAATLALVAAVSQPKTPLPSTPPEKYERRSESERSSGTSVARTRPHPTRRARSDRQCAHPISRDWPFAIRPDSPSGS